MEITIKIEDLERIIKEAKSTCKYDDSLSLCVELYKGKESDIHAQSDSIKVVQLSGYAECMGKTIIYINF